MIHRIILSALCAVLLVAPSVLAQSDSTLQQSIVPDNCSYTTVETGLGRQNDSDCPAFAPIIESIIVVNGRPIIRGIYDAVHTKTFRVQVAGVWYVLGVDHELTADGNVWVLDLSGLAYALSAGEYTVVAEAVMDNDEVMNGGAIMNVTSEQGGVGAPNTGLAPVSILPVIAALASGTGLFLLSVVFFYKSRPGEG